MVDIYLESNRCVIWRCPEPAVDHWCELHNPNKPKPTTCKVCGGPPCPSKGLRRGMCAGCYTWWLRHHDEIPEVAAYG